MDYGVGSLGSGYRVQGFRTGLASNKHKETLNKQFSHKISQIIEEFKIMYSRRKYWKMIILRVPKIILHFDGSNNIRRL